MSRLLPCSQAMCAKHNVLHRQCLSLIVLCVENCQCKCHGMRAVIASITMYGAPFIKMLGWHTVSLHKQCSQYELIFHSSESLSL